MIFTVKQGLGLSLAFTWSTTVLLWGFSTTYYFFMSKLCDKYGITVLLPSLQQMVMWAVPSLKLLGKDIDSCAQCCFAVSPPLQDRNKFSGNNLLCCLSGKAVFHPFPHTAPAWQGTGTISQAFISHCGELHHTVRHKQNCVQLSPRYSETTRLVHLGNWPQVCSLASKRHRLCSQGL